MVEIRAYGKLRRFIKKNLDCEGGVLKVSAEPEETLQQLLTRIGMPLDEIHNIFLNSRLLASRSKMAYWIRYPQVRKDPLDWNLDIPVREGDRIGLFGRDMAALVI